MKAGDLVKLSMMHDDHPLRGIVLDIFPDRWGEDGCFMASVLWTDGDLTEEFPIDLEVVCK